MFPASGNLFDYLPKKPCDSLVVGVSSYSSIEGRFEGKGDFHAYSTNALKLKSTELGRSTFIFESMKHVTKMTSDMTKLASLLGSTSCLTVILETDNTEEVSSMLDIIANIRMESKYCLVQMNTVLDANLFLNKTINFDVIISDADRHLEGRNIYHTNFIKKNSICITAGYER